MPPRARFLLVGHRHQDGEIGFRGAADPDLAAVDDPVVAVAFGAGRHAGRIGARARLGNADSGNRFAAHVRRQIRFALTFVHRRHQHAQIGRVRRQRVRRDGAAHLFVDADHRHGRQVAAADIFRRVEPPQPQLLRDLVEPHVLFRAKTPGLCRRPRAPARRPRAASVPVRTNRWTRSFSMRSSSASSKSMGVPASLSSCDRVMAARGRASPRK